MKENDMPAESPVNAVLLAAADEVERWATHKANYNLRAGAGGHEDAAAGAVAE